MKIAVVGANGKEGRLVVKEALKNDLDVTAVIRSENKTDAKHTIIKDLFNLTNEDLKDFDVVVDAFGTKAGEDLSLHSKSLKHLCDILSNSDTRLIIVGGAGSLYVNKEHSAQVVDGANFPDAYKPLANAMAKALSELRKRDDVKWTYISPACDFRADGERSGNYIIAGEELKLNEKNESIVSYADFAMAVIDEAKSPKYIQKRISIVRK